jgi:hypothetical protein
VLSDVDRSSIQGGGGPRQGEFGDTAFVVVSCDKYSDLWEHFFTLFRRHWPDCPFPVHLVTNHKCNSIDGVTVVAIGDDRSYSDNLRLALDRIGHEWIVMWLDDVFLSGRVDTARLSRMFEHARRVGSGYLKLAADMPMAYEGDSGQEIGPLPKGIRYRAAVGMALYHRNTLLDLLTPGASAWDLDRSDLCDRLDAPFYAFTPSAAKSPPIPYVHLLVKGKWFLDALPFLRREGLVDLRASRRAQSLSSYLRARLYLAALTLLRVARVHWR